MLPNPQFPADLVTFTEEILNRKLHFLCSGPGEITLLAHHLHRHNSLETCLDGYEENAL